MFKIESNVPIPIRGKKISKFREELTETIMKMKIGDSFTMDIKKRATLRGVIKEIQTIEFKLLTRATTNPNVVRVFKTIYK